MFPAYNPTVVSMVGSADSAIGRIENATSVRSSNERNSTNGGGEWLEIFFKGLLIFTRVWGVLAAVVLGGVGVDLAFHQHQIGYYFIGGSVLLLIVEVAWVVTLFLQICVRNTSKFWKCWSAVTWFSNWKKSILYVMMGATPFIWPRGLWLSYVAGGQLIALAVFHFMLSFRNGRRKKRRKSRLLGVDGDSCDSNKFEEITECLDDGLVEPIPSSSHPISDVSLEQDTVLEI